MLALPRRGGASRARHRRDDHEVLSSDAVLHVVGKPRATGNHTELGISLTRSIPMHVVKLPWPAPGDDEPCIFLELVGPAHTVGV